MTDILLMGILCTILFVSFKFMNASITIVYKQEFSEEDRQLLEDLYNKDGEMKEKMSMDEALDSAVQAINDIMLDNEEGSNG